MPPVALPCTLLLHLIWEARISVTAAAEQPKTTVSTRQTHFMLSTSLGQRILTPLASRQAARGPIGLQHHLGHLQRRQPLACSSGSQMSDSLLGKRKAQDISKSAEGRHASTKYTIEHTQGPSYKAPGLLITDHTFRVPLDYSGKTPGTINVFCRELVAPVNARRQQPYLLYLQGGPGFESPRPTEASGWLKCALGSFRVVLMDQRGTGRSSPITTNTLAAVGAPDKQAHYLSFFRADSIVADAEMIRQVLVPEDQSLGPRWSILGQSFGGFCAFTYLSMAPDGLVEVLTTGGVPPAISQPCSAEAVYKALFKRVLLQNERYYARFPEDVGVVGRIVNFLAAQPEGCVVLPSGTRLTPRTLQLLGLSGLGSGGGFERLHYLLESFFDGEDSVNPTFAKAFESWMSWGTNPLYVLLHESIYCQGAASNWAAHRVREQHYAAEFDAVAAARAGRPVLFTGEMVFPWMFDDFACLTPYKEAANLLAAKTDWPGLYRQGVLRENKVPVACATYLDDMYVDYNLAQDTLEGVAGVKQWVTNEFKHSGIRDDGSRIVDRLLGMVRDVVLLE